MLVVCVALTVCVAGALPGVADSLKVNLVTTEGKALVYGGAGSGIAVGQVFDIRRNGKSIGNLKIVEVKKAYAVGEVVSAAFEIREGDELVSLGTAPSATDRPGVARIDDDGAAKADGKKDIVAKKDEKKTDAGAKDDAPVKDAKKTDAAKKTDKKTDAVKKDDSANKTDTAKKTDKKADAAKKDDKKADTPKKDDKKAGAPKNDAKKDDKSTAKDSGTDAQKAEVVLKPHTFATKDGFSGYWNVPVAEVLPEKKASISYYSLSDSYSYYLNNYEKQYVEVENGEVDATDFAIAYGIGNNLEVAAAKGSISREISGKVTSPTVSETYKSSQDYDTLVVGVKYMTTEKYFLDPETGKKWVYGAALQYVDMDYAQGVRLTGMMSFPLLNKINMTAGIFYDDWQESNGTRVGSLLAMNLPMSQDIEIVGDMKLFRGDYDFSFGGRYIYKDTTSLLFGLSDITNDQKDRNVNLGLSHNF